MAYFLRLSLFVVFVWIAGKVASLIGMPGLVGEIACGWLLGRPGFDLVPFQSALKQVGNLGITLLFVEAGLMVDIEMLEIIGKRGLVLGLIGTVAPAVLAGIGPLLWNGGFLESTVSFSALATMSTGISLNVLKAGAALNRPIGQLVIAAATVNEILSIIFLAQVDAFVTSGSKVESHIIPVIVVFILTALIATAAVFFVPKFLDKKLLPAVPRKHRPEVLLALVLTTALVLVPLCTYTGASGLLGAFLAGLCYCSDRAVHEVWDKQVKRLLRWLLRFFFAASVGFALPSSIDTSSFAKALLFFVLAMPGKLVVGFLAPKPLTQNNVTTLATAWGVWGEVAFVIVDLAREKITDSTANGIVLATLVSMVVMPSILRATLDRVEKRAQKKIAQAYHETEDSDDIEVRHHQTIKRATYFCIQTRSPAHWNLMDAVLAAVPSACEIIDVRSYHPNDHIGASHLVVELYFRDPHLTLPATTQLSHEEEAELTQRAALLVEKLKKALGSPTEDYDIRVKRWLPGFFRHYHQKPPTIKKPSFGNSRSCSDPSHLFQQAWSRVDSRKYLDAECLTGAFRVEPSHELDGFVHTDAHRPFCLPDDADDPLLLVTDLEEDSNNNNEEKVGSSFSLHRHSLHTNTSRGVSNSSLQNRSTVATSLFEGLTTLLVDGGHDRLRADMPGSPEQQQQQQHRDSPRPGTRREEDHLPERRLGDDEGHYDHRESSQQQQQQPFLPIDNDDVEHDVVLIASESSPHLPSDTDSNN